jgi:hypothetical protein
MFLKYSMPCVFITLLSRVPKGNLFRGIDNSLGLAKSVVKTKDISPEVPFHKITSSYSYFEF